MNEDGDALDPSWTCNLWDRDAFNQDQSNDLERNHGQYRRCHSCSLAYPLNTSPNWVQSHRMSHMMTDEYDHVLDANEDPVYVAKWHEDVGGGVKNYQVHHTDLTLEETLRLQEENERFAAASHELQFEDHDNSADEAEQGIENDDEADDEENDGEDAAQSENMMMMVAVNALIDNSSGTGIDDTLLEEMCDWSLDKTFAPTFSAHEEIVCEEEQNLLKAIDAEAEAFISTEPNLDFVYIRPKQTKYICLVDYDKYEDVSEEVKAQLEAEDANLPRKSMGAIEYMGVKELVQHRMNEHAWYAHQKSVDKGCVDTIGERYAIAKAFLKKHLTSLEIATFDQALRWKGGEKEYERISRLIEDCMEERAEETRRNSNNKVASLQAQLNALESTISSIKEVVGDTAQLKGHFDALQQLLEGLRKEVNTYEECVPKVPKLKTGAFVRKILRIAGDFIMKPVTFRKTTPGDLSEKLGVPRFIDHRCNDIQALAAHLLQRYCSADDEASREPIGFPTRPAIVKEEVHTYDEDGVHSTTTRVYPHLVTGEFAVDEAMYFDKKLKDLQVCKDLRRAFGVLFLSVYHDDSLFTQTGKTVCPFVLRLLNSSPLCNRRVWAHAVLMYFEKVPIPNMTTKSTAAVTFRRVELQAAWKAILTTLRVWEESTLELAEKGKYVLMKYPESRLDCTTEPRITEYKDDNQNVRCKVTITRTDVVTRSNANGRPWVYALIPSLADCPADNKAAQASCMSLAESCRLCAAKRRTHNNKREEFKGGKGNLPVENKEFCDVQKLRTEALELFSRFRNKDQADPSEEEITAFITEHQKHISKNDLMAFIEAPFLNDLDRAHYIVLALFSFDLMHTLFLGLFAYCYNMIIAAIGFAINQKGLEHIGSGGEQFSKLEHKAKAKLLNKMHANLIDGLRKIGLGKHNIMKRTEAKEFEILLHGIKTLLVGDLSSSSDTKYLLLSAQFSKLIACHDSCERMGYLLRLERPSDRTIEAIEAEYKHLDTLFQSVRGMVRPLGKKSDYGMAAVSSDNDNIITGAALRTLKSHIISHAGTIVRQRGSMNALDLFGLEAFHKWEPKNVAMHVSPNSVLRKGGEDKMRRSNEAHGADAADIYRKRPGHTYMGYVTSPFSTEDRVIGPRGSSHTVQLNDISESEFMTHCGGKINSFVGVVFSHFCPSTTAESDEEALLQENTKAAVLSFYSRCLQTLQGDSAIGGSVEFGQDGQVSLDSGKLMRLPGLLQMQNGTATMKPASKLGIAWDVHKKLHLPLFFFKFAAVGTDGKEESKVFSVVWRFKDSANAFEENLEGVFRGRPMRAIRTVRIRFADLEHGSISIMPAKELRSLFTQVPPEGNGSICTIRPDPGMAFDTCAFGWDLHPFPIGEDTEPGHFVSKCICLSDNTYSMEGVIAAFNEVGNYYLFVYDVARYLPKGKGTGGNGRESRENLDNSLAIKRIVPSLEDSSHFLEVKEIGPMLCKPNTDGSPPLRASLMVDEFHPSSAQVERALNRDNAGQNFLTKPFVSLKVCKRDRSEDYFAKVVSYDHTSQYHVLVWSEFPQGHQLLPRNEAFTRARIDFMEAGLHVSIAFPSHPGLQVTIQTTEKTFKSVPTTLRAPFFTQRLRLTCAQEAFDKMVVGKEFSRSKKRSRDGTILGDNFVIVAFDFVSKRHVGRNAQNAERGEHTQSKDGDFYVDIEFSCSSNQDVWHKRDVQCQCDQSSCNNQNYADIFKGKSGKKYRCSYGNRAYYVTQ